jgi:hypothetical protein
MLSIILAINLFSVSSDTIQIKSPQNISYQVFANDSNLCFQYKLGKNWSQLKTLVNGKCYSPSIAITPGDFIHIVYGDSNSIYYLTTTSKIDKSFIKSQGNVKWTPKYCVSAYMSFTEPASNPSIIAVNDNVYISWHSHDRVWRRCRDITEPYYLWLEPEDMGK